MDTEDPLLRPTLGLPYRDAHAALRRLLPPETLTAESDAYLPVIVEDLQDVARLAVENAAAHLGPTLQWVGPEPRGNPWSSVTLQLDLDALTDDDPPGVSEIHDWDASALALAAKAYRKECRWDFSPGEAGMWLVSVAPYASTGSGPRMYWTGTLTGFVIIHDRDGDGAYESLAHLWTAKEWRHQGIATGLVRTARERFALIGVEGPVTEAGKATLMECAPELLSDSA